MVSESVHHRLSQLPNRLDQLRTLRLRPRVTGAERDQRPVLKRLRNLRQRRQLQEPYDRSDVVGQGWSPLEVVVDDLAASARRPDR